MFSGNQRREISLMALYSAIYYLPFMLSAKNTSR